MGQSAVTRQTTPSLTMKFLVVLALSGLAMAEPEAEADPALLYGQYGYGGFGYPYAYGYGLRKAFAAWNPYRALHYRRHYYGKREAEAEPKPEADPQMLLNGFQQAFPVTSRPSSIKLTQSRPSRRPTSNRLPLSRQSRPTHSTSSSPLPRPSRPRHSTSSQSIPRQSSRHSSSSLSSPTPSTRPSLWPSRPSTSSPCRLSSVMPLCRRPLQSRPSSTQSRTCRLLWSRLSPARTPSPTLTSSQSARLRLRPTLPC